jgi:hypothetical protein
MLRLVRFGIVCSSVSSATLFAVACLAWRSGERRPSAIPRELVQIAPQETSLGDIKARSVNLLRFTVSNRSSRTIRVLGVDSFCTTWGCIRPVGLPVTVPPQSNREVQLLLKAALAGDHEFNTDVNWYWDWPGEPTASVRIQGRVVEGRREALKRAGGPPTHSPIPEGGTHLWDIGVCTRFSGG